MLNRLKLEPVNLFESRLIFRTFGWLVIAVGLQSLFSCTSAPKGEHQIKSFFPTSLRVRRPETAGAVDRAGPGGVDYQTSSQSDDLQKCQRPDVLFQSVSLESLRTCLSQTTTDVTVSYRLNYGDSPFLELIKEEEKTPECLLRTLPKILVPREIVFQTVQQGELGCFSSGLDSEKDRRGGIKLPIAKRELVIGFPMPSVPKNDDETARMLLAWAISPFMDADQQIIRAKVLTDRLCQSCLGGEREMIKPKDHIEQRNYPLWP